MHMAKKQKRYYLLNTGSDLNGCQNFIDGTCDKSQQFVLQTVNGSNESEYRGQPVIIFDVKNVSGPDSIQNFLERHPDVKLCYLCYTSSEDHPAIKKLSYDLRFEKIDISNPYGVMDKRSEIAKYMDFNSQPPRSNFSDFTADISKDFFGFGDFFKEEEIVERKKELSKGVLVITSDAAKPQLTSIIERTYGDDLFRFTEDDKWKDYSDQQLVMVDTKLKKPLEPFSKDNPNERTIIMLSTDKDAQLPEKVSGTSYTVNDAAELFGLGVEGGLPRPTHQRRKPADKKQKEEEREDKGPKRPRRKDDD